MSPVRCHRCGRAVETQAVTTVIYRTALGRDLCEACMTELEQWFYPWLRQGLATRAAQDRIRLALALLARGFEGVNEERWAAVCQALAQAERDLMGWTAAPTESHE